MKKVLFLFMVARCMIAGTQEKLSDITIPTSPAASVLGLQANDILALPYGATNHGLTLTDYLFPKTIGTQVVTNSSFSIASTQNLILGDSSNTNGLGFG